MDKNVDGMLFGIILIVVGGVTAAYLDPTGGSYYAVGGYVPNSSHVVFSILLLLSGILLFVVSFLRYLKTSYSKLDSKGKKRVISAVIILIIGAVSVFVLLNPDFLSPCETVLCTDNKCSIQSEGYGEEYITGDLRFEKNNPSLMKSENYKVTPYEAIQEYVDCPAGEHKVVYLDAPDGRISLKLVYYSEEDTFNGSKSLNEGALFMTDESSDNSSTYDDIVLHYESGEVDKRIVPLLDEYGDMKAELHIFLKSEDKNPNSESYYNYEYVFPLEITDYGESSTVFQPLD